MSHGVASVCISKNSTLKTCSKKENKTQRERLTVLCGWRGGKEHREMEQQRKRKKGLMDMNNSVVIVGGGAGEGGRKYRGHKW